MVFWVIGLKVNFLFYTLPPLSFRGKKTIKTSIIRAKSSFYSGRINVVTKQNYKNYFIINQTWGEKPFFAALSVST